MINTLKKMFSRKIENGKRGQVRVTADHYEPIRVDVSGKNFVDIVPAKDISMSGVGIQIPGYFEGREIEGDVALSITIPHPMKHKISTSGKIVHKGNSYFGATFMNIDDKDQAKLQDYITKQVRQGDIA